MCNWIQFSSIFAPRILLIFLLKTLIGALYKASICMQLTKLWELGHPFVPQKQKIKHEKYNSCIGVDDLDAVALEGAKYRLNKC
jgi:hypothetical protein